MVVKYYRGTGKKKKLIKRKEKGVVTTGAAARKAEAATATAQARLKAEHEAQKPRAPEVKPVIKLEPKKKGLAALVEKPTVAGKVAKVLTSPKTTLVLGTVLAGLLTAGGATATTAIGGGAGRAIITRTAYQGARSLVSQRAFVGKAGKFALDKVFHAVRPVAARFATNPKTIGSSISMLSKIGLSLGAASLAVGALGSYPFAGFIKEEAVQTLNIGIFKAVDAGDDEGAERLIGEIDEILDAEGSIMSKIPYANVLSALTTFFEATRETNEEWKRIINIRKEEAAGERETEFARERRISDEAAFERKREFAAEEEERYGKIQEESDERRRERIKEDTERFAEIRETAGEEKAAGIAADEERFAEIREASQQRELDELNFKEEYFALIRDGRYEEAAALLDAYEAKLKGGV